MQWYQSIEEKLKELDDARAYLGAYNAYGLEYIALHQLVAWPFPVGLQKEILLGLLVGRLDANFIESIK